MLTGKEFISDYESNREDIEKWFSIKCPEKYMRFAELLESKGLESTWKNIVDLYRYDKRLIYNVFKYVSFLEEYLRAIVVRNDDSKDAYDRWQEETMGPLGKKIIELHRERKSGIDNDSLEEDVNNVRKLRNIVSHNRILLEEPYMEYLDSLIRVLPEEYRNGCRHDFDACNTDLSIGGCWIYRPKNCPHRKWPPI